ncbi:MurB family protein [Bacteroidia bacterium]|nr:MurB family protein [Bacteroidia bacterium]
MKIGILTQPLLNNYGGLLQAFALQTILQRMGHEAWIVDRHLNMNLARKIANFVKNILYYFILGKKNLFPIWISEKQKQILAKNTSVFVNNYIQYRTKPLNSNSALRKEIERKKFDAYIVGSDQVWRPVYSPCITNYFLDFAKEYENIKRVAYAASFGVETWEFKTKQTQVCADLIQKFDAVSVREQSGIALCKEYFNVNAVCALDPTLLLDKSEYIKLVMDAEETVSDGKIMTYILDATSEKSSIVKKVVTQLGLNCFSVMPSKTLNNRPKDIESCIFPSVTKWLRGFMDAEFVITDSFHACVFSIIFNKPFLAIGNKERGMDRFNSLLNIFDLRDMLICSLSDLKSQNIKILIDWEKVNNIISKKREESILFIKQGLSINDVW